MKASRLVQSLAACLFFSSAFGQPVSSGSKPAAPRDPSNESLAVRAGPSYPTPYAPASVEQIQAVMQRVHRYLDANSAIRVTNRETQQAVADLQRLPPNMDVEFSGFRTISYEWGVTYAGMLLAAQVTGDSRYRTYTESRMDSIARLSAHFRAQSNGGVPEEPEQARRFPLRSVLKPHSLDDSGAMCAAMIKAIRAGLSADLRPAVDTFINYISTGQQRLADGTLARNRPLAETLWLDDLYMSVPALAQMGKLTGERRYFDDAAKQILQFSERMFVREKGLYMHGWVNGMNPHPVFHWARANGWASMAMVELLDVMPENHPQRETVLEVFRAHVKGLAAVQGAKGLWHQLLDRSDSYEETSATAMFVFAIARGINRGWLDTTAYGSMASLGWNAVVQKVNAEGQVEGTCIGTGMGWDPMFYYYRPVSVYAAHGYGPLFLAGSEMILLRQGKGTVAAIRDGGVHFGEQPKS